MNHSFQVCARRVGAAVVSVAVGAVLALWSFGSLSGPGSAMPLAQATVSEASVSPTTGYVRLHLPRGMATVVLDDTDAGRAFSSELPLELDLRDPMGQAKSGRLPHPIDVAATGRVVDPEVGILYYWPQSGDIAIYYDDLGQTVPPTGLVRLGVVASGMEVLAEAGSRFAVQIER